ncbi:MAG: hypothetical protein U0667_17485 [Chloroflexota bacterium]
MLALLDRPLVFSQRALLDTTAFERESRERGLWLTQSSLDRLHTAGVLVPMYISRRPMRGVRATVRGVPEDTVPGLPVWIFNTDAVGLREDRDGGFLKVPRATPPKTPRGRQIEGQWVQVWERLYSPYQLLDLPDVKNVFHHVGRPRLDKWERVWLDAERERVAGRHDHLVLLSALEVHYYPRVVRSIRSPFGRDGKTWDGYDREFDAAELARWLGWTPEALLEAAKDLLRRARHVDPLDNWTELVSLVAPSQWKRLHGDALVGLELRIAAEMILRFLEDLRRKRLAPPLPAASKRVWHELHGRLRADRERLDVVLSDFGLSPHPAVLLVVEGETEEAMISLVMEELGIPRDDSYIRVVNAKTETRDHMLLVSYATLPRLGPIEQDQAEFLRPPTRYFIAVDGDRHYRTAAKREAERRKWVNTVAAGLPAAVRASATALADIDSLVRLETWADGLDFERANFSDAELAQAIAATGLAPPLVSQGSIESLLAQQRARATTGQLGSLGSVWFGWPRAPSKPDLALALWPMLSARIRSKRSRTGVEQIPVARLLLQANDMARQRPRGRTRFVLRVL